MAKILVLFSCLSLNCINTVWSGRVDDGCDPDDPNSFQLSIKQMCELVPDRGHGERDIVRVYFNPVLQQCLPFSWSGEGGNANRFVSIKNCYEICHPSDPGVRKLTSSGIRPYLKRRPPPKHCNDDREGIPELGIPPFVDTKSKDRQKMEEKEEEDSKEMDVVVRQIKHPYDPSKTLTIVQPVKYIIKDGKDSKDKVEKPRVIIEKHIRHVPTYLMPQNPPPYRQSAQPMQPQNNGGNGGNGQQMNNNYLK